MECHSGIFYDLFTFSQLGFLPKDTDQVELDVVKEGSLLVLVKETPVEMYWKHGS